MKHTWVYYADDLVLMASTRNELRRKLVEWRASLLVKGLKVNARKIKPTVGGGGGGIDYSSDQSASHHDRLG